MERNNNPNSNETMGHVTIGMKAPDFSAESTFGHINLADYTGKWLILFSHPGDFTPVCTTEFIAFAQLFQEFKNRNTELLGLSIDSNASHLAWVNAVYQANGMTIPFPIIADRMGEIARLYGMLAPDVSRQATVRSVYVIDPNRIVRAIIVYPMTTGRNIYEILRLIDALQTTDSADVPTPANWIPGMPTLVPAPQTYEALYRRLHDPAAMSLTCKDWYLCYHKTNPDETTHAQPTFDA
ncbi:MAG: peroxiredoxin [Candidatus Fimivivens sp.]